MIALNLNEENRILSACKVLPAGIYTGMPIVDNIPNGNIYDYKYIDGEFIYNPLRTIEEDIQQPTQLDTIEAQVIYTAMMTGTLLEGGEIE